jgi:hypothetical protein
MSAALQVLAEAEAGGVELRADGDGVLFRPADSLPPALRAELREHLPELLPVLRTRQVLAMPLSAFATAGLRLMVYSELLGERMIFASDDAHLPASDSGCVLYRAKELRELLGLGPAELRRVHLVKRTFQGTVAPEQSHCQKHPRTSNLRPAVKAPETLLPLSPAR